MLPAILIFGLLTQAAPGRWALSLFQVALFSTAIYNLIAVKWRPTLHPVALLLAAIPLWGLVQILLGWTVDPYRTLEEILNWTANLSAFALALKLASDPQRRASLPTGTLVVGTIFATCALVTMFAAPPGSVLWLFDSGTGLPTFGPFVYRNQFASFVEVVLPLALLRAIDSRDPTARLGYWGIVGLLLASVVGAGSRTGTLLCLAEIFVMPILIWYQSRISLSSAARTLATVAIVATLGVGVVGWQPILARVQEPHPYSFRAYLLQSSFNMVRVHPWTGFGLGTWSSVYPGFALFDDGFFVNQAHSDWAQWTVEGGMPLLLLMLLLFVRIFPVAWRSIWGVGLIAVFLHCLVDYPMQQRPALAAYFLAFAGVVLAETNTPHNPKIDQALEP